jgi:hypothetical protein
MDFDLFAQANNNAAFQAGRMVGIILAVLICASIPIAVGNSKGQPVLGVIGGILAGGAAVLLGCLGGLPMALVFVIIILVVGGSTPKRRPSRRREYDDDDDDDDDYDRRRRRRRDDDDDDDDDRRPRRRND